MKESVSIDALVGAFGLAPFASSIFDHFLTDLPVRLASVCNAVEHVHLHWTLIPSTGMLTILPS
jgi:REP element-mobilizing transposase RayT